MSHLPDIALRTWKSGQGLAAADLNANFAALLSLIETVMHAALTPDPAGVANEVRIGNHEERISALEALVTMHARQRNERELTPLAYTAAVMQQVRELREPVLEAAGRLEQAHAHARTLHQSHAQRLARLEQQPEAATAEAHDVLAAAHAALAEKVTVTLAQAIALRHEVAVLHKMAAGHDRLANRLEFAPLSTMGHLLQRIMELEKRLEVAP